MIKSIQLKNFQSHQDSKLEFGPGINVICGQSDSGKSAIIRAFRWVIENRPGGGSFISNFSEGECQVIVETNDGFIAREKSKKVNSYWLNEQEIKAMGQDVPEEIAKALNMLPVNIQYQMDSPFLLSQGSGAIAQYLNQTVKLDVIDHATSNIRKQILDVNQNLKSTKSFIEQSEIELLKYDKIDDLYKHLNFIEKKEELLNIKKKSAKELKAAIDIIEELQKRIVTPTFLLSVYKPFEQNLQKNNKLLMEKRDKLSRLNSVVNLYKHTERRLQELKPLSFLSSFMPVIKKKQLLLEEKNKRYDKLLQIFSSYKLIIDKLQLTKNKLAVLEDEQKKATPKKCPTCSRPWGI